MGQLEPFGVNEMYLSGLMLGLLLNYVSEARESDTFESLKAYFYSVSFSVSSKIKRVEKRTLEVITNTQAMYNSWTYFNLSASPSLKMTKIIDNFPIWQDISLVDFKVDDYVLKLQRKYNW